MNRVQPNVLFWYKLELNLVALIMEQKLRGLRYYWRVILKSTDLWHFIDWRRRTSHASLLHVKGILTLVRL